MGSFPDMYNDPLRHIRGVTIFANENVNPNSKNTAKNVILPFLQQVLMAAVRILASK